VKTGENQGYSVVFVRLKTERISGVPQYAAVYPLLPAHRTGLFVLEGLYERNLQLNRNGHPQCCMNVTVGDVTVVPEEMILCRVYSLCCVQLQDSALWESLAGMPDACHHNFAITQPLSSPDASLQLLRRNSVALKVTGHSFVAAAAAAGVRVQVLLRA